MSPTPKRAQDSYSAFSSTKIQDRHLDRTAIVYVRQSSVQQVLEHRESTAMQYALVDRAVALGWPRDRVRVIDEDQGQSAQSAEGRLGFQKLLAEISLDHVGLVLGIEMSRLARSCKDWHQLLELCALFQTLLGDQDGLYDPTHYNDRLLLGLKGTMSEAELHIIRARMNQGRLNKAKRGELFNHPPLGYIRGPSGEILMDPDEQVQTVVRLIFEKFRELGSIHALLQYLVRHQIRVGVRPHFGSNRGQLEWRRPNRASLQNLLHHPVYAGAYRYGHRPTDPRSKIAGRKSTGRKILRAEDCTVLLKDRLPAYISWEAFEENRKRLNANRARAEAWGAAREGDAILPGLVVCGRCGHRMTVCYPGKGSLRYDCMRNHVDYGEPHCQSFAGNPLEALVSKQVLKALEPASLELSLASADRIQREHKRLQAHWKQRLERSEFETDRAARQFHAVEPENRLVGRSLEQRWESALSEHRKLQEEYERFEREQSSILKECDRDKILQLSADIPTLWSKASTTPQDRQRIVRLLLQKAVVTVDGSTEKVRVELHWSGGLASRHELIRPVAKYEQLSNYSQLLDRIEKLYEKKKTPEKIAEQLNQEGWRPPKRRDTFNRSIVRTLLARRRKPCFRPTRKCKKHLKKGEWWMGDLARKLEIPMPTVYVWIRRGWIAARQLEGRQGCWILWADSSELDRLRRLRTRRRGWTDDKPSQELTTPNKVY